VKVTQDKIEGRQAYLTVEMEPAEVEESLKKAYSRLVQKANIPGFRKGKVPRPILEQFIGKEALLEDAVEHMVPDVFEKAVKEKDIKPITRPEVQVEKMEPVTYKMIVPLEPVVKLADYHSLKLAPESVELKEEDINKTIEQIRREHSIWEPVDRQVNGRDKVILDIESNVGAQPYINQKDAEYEVIKESEFPIKGFSEELIGMKKGDTKEFKLSFPQEYGRPELAGKETSFKVTVKEVKQEKLVELNEELAQKVNPEYKTVEDLRNKVVNDLKENAEAKAKRDFQQKILDFLVEKSEIEFPPVLEEDELNNLIDSEMRRWQVDEKGLDQYLQSINKTPEQFREELRPSAVRSLKQSLAITEVAKAENIKVEPSDLNDEINNITKGIPDQNKEQFINLLSSPRSQASMGAAIATRRTIARLEEIVQSTSESTEKSDIETTEIAEKSNKEAEK
jgi:trigger factor